MTPARRNYQPHYGINYLFAVPSVALDRRSPFQGFTPQLFAHATHFARLVSLPSDCFSASLTRDGRLAFRSAGMASWLGTPAAIASLLALSTADLVERPFLIVFTIDAAATAAIADWISAQVIPILHVSEIAHDTAIQPEDLTFELVRDHCRAVLDAIEPYYEPAPLERLRVIVDAWEDSAFVKAIEPIPSDLVTLPNVFVLTAGNYSVPAAEMWVGNDEASYGKAAVDACDAVQALRDEITHQPVHNIAPPRPDVIVAAPAMYNVAWAAAANGAPSSQRHVVRRLLSAFERQTGFHQSIGDPAQIAASPIASTLLATRIQELDLYASAVGLRAASTLSAVVRVPPGVNRANGIVVQLANMARSGRPRRDLLRTFDKVQERLDEAVGPDLKRCIADSLHGVKLISDAPLEWLPMGELPLGLARITSRLTSTPGDLLMQKLAENDAIQIPSEAFRDILVISSFKEGDILSGLVKASISNMAPAWGNKLNIKSVDVSTGVELISALNDFDGPLVIFDGHGSHDGRDNVGRLLVGDEAIDVWSLRDQVRCPPIVILSACDTHAAGKSHATTANGFLALGARAVVGTLFPVRGLDAAVLVGRMMLRIAEFIPAAMKEFGRGILWSEMVTGLLQMNFLSDLMMSLLDKGIVTTQQYLSITKYGNGAINSFSLGWFDYVKAAIQKEVGISDKDLQRYIRDTIVASDVTRYVHMGNPETIVIGDIAEITAALIAGHPDSEQAKFFADAYSISQDINHRVEAETSAVKPATAAT